MYDEFVTGSIYPREEDEDRLARYSQAAKLMEGDHGSSEKARRITAKLSELKAYYGYDRPDFPEGAIWIVLNLPRLICEKFSDLQLLQTPLVVMDSDVEEAKFQEKLTKDVPDLWARLHDAFTIRRGYGDAILSVTRRPKSDVAELRVIEPDRWFPVLDPNDPLTVTSHQIAWCEDHDIEGKTVKILRVDVGYPDLVERRAFVLEQHSEITGSQKLKRKLSQSEMDRLWPGISLQDKADLGGLMPFVHLRNGQLDPAYVFGRPEFLDSASLIDDIDWRLSCWSDVNDKISHPPRSIPKSYLKQDEKGNVSAPSRYTEVFAQQSMSGEVGEKPAYMTIGDFDHATLLDQFVLSVEMLLMRHQMAPAFLGWQKGNEKESGEAKSLGMSTTEAAAQRDLLRVQPSTDQALTAVARLGGAKGAEVSTVFRVGLPPTREQVLADLDAQRRLGVITRREIVERLNPFLQSDQIDKKLAEIDKERKADMAEMEPQFAESDFGG